MKKRLLTLGTAAGVAFGLTGGAAFAAEGAPFTITRTSTPSSVILGDTVEFTVEVRGPSNDSFRITEDLRDLMDHSSQVPLILELKRTETDENIPFTIEGDGILRTDEYFKVGETGVFSYTYTVLIDDLSDDSLVTSETCFQVPKPTTRPEPTRPPLIPMRDAVPSSEDLPEGESVQSRELGDSQPGSEQIVAPAEDESGLATDNCASIAVPILVEEPPVEVPEDPDPSTPEDPDPSTPEDPDPSTPEDPDPSSPEDPVAPAPTEPPASEPTDEGGQSGSLAATGAPAGVGALAGVAALLAGAGSVLFGVRKKHARE